MNHKLKVNRIEKQQAPLSSLLTDNLKIVKLFCVFLLSSLISFSQGIKFEEGLSWNQVLQKAKTENKLIFVDCFATWCGPCKMMDKDVYPNRRVGDEVNGDFIAVKVQFDSSKNDDAQVRRWYKDAKHFKDEHKINGYPTFLFFNPEGNILHKDEGYKSVGDFVRMIKLARDPLRKEYYSQLEEYKKGIYNYKTMPGLALFMVKLLNDKDLAYAIAKQCKENYLDTLSESKLINREYLEFFGYFTNLINSKDQIFRLCYNDPGRLDSIKQWKGWSNLIVSNTIVREEIERTVLKDGKATIKNPNWNKILSTISDKYKKMDANYLVLDYKLSYYQNLFLDWNLWAKAKEEMIQYYPPKQPYGLSVYTDINGWRGAWLVFMKCNKKDILRKALDWIDLAISLDGENHKSAYLDTKANLLYKLGKRDDAIKLEREAIGLEPNAKDYSIALNKMLNNEPTYVHQGAIWDKNTLPKKRN